MNLEDFFRAIGSDYHSALARMGNSKDKLKKYVKMFSSDTTAEDLFTAFRQEDYVSAFMFAHTLKGLCATLGFSTLHASASELTEALRNTVSENANELFDKVYTDYSTLSQALAQLTD